MAPVQNGENTATMTPAARRRARKRGRTTLAIRPGTATGGGQDPTLWTPDQRKFYALGAKHAAEIMGVTLPTGMFAQRT